MNLILQYPDYSVNLLTISAVFLFTQLITSVYSHVALTFPKARYDLDFLDNGRTKAPCGVPKNGPGTSLPAGIQFNVTWHLAYPHRGGFKLELLDPSEQTILNLTPTTSPGDDFIGDEDSTAQSYSITLPKGLVCRGCTLRLLRQAREWGHRYTFWSCADVDIVPVTNIMQDRKSVCSGNGHFNFYDGKCYCNRLYSGIVCQFTDECWTDEDCGSNGKCIPINGTYPTKQCFCKVGWYGEKCSKESSIKSHEIDLSHHSHRQLTEGFDLYWRLLKQEGEIEVVLKLKGTSYAAIGWRPQGISSKCKAFPLLIENAVTATPPIVASDEANKRIDSETVETSPTFKKIKVMPVVPNILNKPQASQPTSTSTAESTPVDSSTNSSVAGKRLNTLQRNPKTYSQTPAPEPKPSSEATSEASSSESSNVVYSEETPVSEPLPDGKQDSQPGAVPETRLDTAPLSPIPLSSSPQPLPEPSTSPEPESTSKPELTTINPISEPTSLESDPKIQPELESSTSIDSSVSSSSESEPAPKSSVEAESVSKLEPMPNLDPSSDISTAAPSQPEPITSISVGDSPKSEPLPVTTEIPISEAESKTERSSSVSSEAAFMTSSESSLMNSESTSTETEAPRSSESYGTDGSGEDSSKISFEPPDADDIIQPKVEFARTKRETKPVASPVPAPTSSPVGSASRTGGENGWQANDYPAPTAYTPRADFHPMDCNDIVIGSARGEYGRIFDYYTRDRSTPRVDSFYGGNDDLTAGLVVENDGVTTVVFRKKLVADELSDHTILNATMDVIWAKGQEPGKYVHNPASGLETGKALNANFYREDEIKYHGHKDQRGKLALNFFENFEKFEKVEKVEKTFKKESPVDVVGGQCKGEFRYPSTCRGRVCDYIATWKYNPDLDIVEFTVSAKRVDKWTGIGFSRDTSMPKTDTVIAWVEPGGRYLMMDAWLEDHGQPKADFKQSIFNISALAENGLITFKFARKIDTEDVKNDIPFTECVYFFYPVGGGLVDSSRKNIRKHLQTPLKSNDKICLNQCRSQELQRASSKNLSEKEPVSTPKTESAPSSTPPPSTSEPIPKTSIAPTKPDLSEKMDKLETAYGKVCEGEWRYPERCMGYGCDYHINWEYVDDNDEIMFTIKTKNTNRWTGIGFSDDKLMPETDVIIGIVEESGRFFLMDTWLEDYSQRPLDKKQDIHNMTAWRENGITSLKFYRYRKTDDVYDFQFSDTHCPYLMFPVRGGVFNAVNKRIRKHEVTPIVSEHRVCIRSCSSKPAPSTTVQPKIEPEKKTTITLPISTTSQVEYETTLKQEIKSTESSSRTEEPKTTPPQTKDPVPTTIKPKESEKSKNDVTPDPDVEEDTENEVPSDESMVIMEIRMPNAWKSSLSKKSSPEYRKLMTKLEDQLEKELQDTGHPPKQVEVTNLSGVGENGVLATIRVEINNSTGTRARVDKPVMNLKAALNATIRDGKVGNLAVDPSYLIFKEPETIDLFAADDTKKAGLSSEQMTYLIIIIGLSSLVILCIFQALCMLWRDNRNKGKRLMKKSMANSHYKDYSATTTSSAYSYENFAVTDDPDGLGYKQMNGAKMNGRTENGVRKKGSKSSNGGPGYNSTVDRNMDSKTSSFGYPSSYGTHERSKENNSTFRYFNQPQPRTPDFYFMPHQRRYSGEVVRVFVDYNNPQYIPK
ncbi:uncharacterized protein LOC141852736 isoform X2 [Brevipalpus obovatus]|uniref:uncharacterized protein LOC141852736 isoform X2 n=1 Tax=Brevipalpus obovatus TaxID=246614 RepID=UPI003D9E92D2